MQNPEICTRGDEHRAYPQLRTTRVVMPSELTLTASPTRNSPEEPACTTEINWLLSRRTVISTPGVVDRVMAFAAALPLGVPADQTNL